MDSMIRYFESSKYKEKTEKRFGDVLNRDDIKVVPLYVYVEDGERLTRALSREKKQPRPQYEEMCRRFLADQADFSDEKVHGAGIRRYFENCELSACTEEIAVYISSFL